MAFDLSSLLKDVPDLGTGREQIEYIKLDLIDEDPNNFYQLSGIDELAANIELCGLQQPIRVRRHGDGRYRIVSGHRRRAAVAMLAQDNPDKWSEVPCIIETDEVSPALQQLRLIFANSSTRKMTSAEISEQAEQVENLLYQLKEEGYEFPGRMRDHVAEAVCQSKSKLARLKVIRENLDSSWVDDWKEGRLTEAQAYALAQMPGFWQSIIKENWSYSVGSLYADTIARIKERFQKVNNIEGSCGLCICEHTTTMMAKNAKETWMTPCTVCCLDCSDLLICKNCCPEAAGEQKKLKAEDKAAKREEKQHLADLDRPGAEFAKLVYHRIGEARSRNDVSVEAVTKARGVIYSAVIDEPKQIRMENGEGNYTSNTYLPLGTSVRACDLLEIVAVADALGCSIDYLLGRTDRMEIVPESGTIREPSEIVPDSGTIWHPITEGPPVGQRLVWLDCDGTCDTGRYLGGGEIDEYCVVLWKEARWWAELPKED